MKLIHRYLGLLIAGVLLLASCARRTTLSDRELAQVFHDAFLSNAYASTEGLRLDSLKLYEPIFLKYGYTTEDVQYSIGNFSLRKSARLSDVVERAISMLESRGRELDKEVAILDTVDNIAKRLTTRVIHSDSLFTYRSRSDSAAMVVVIEPIAAGSYKIEFDYLIDTLDTTTKNYNTKSWVEIDRKEGEELLDDKGRKIADMMDEEAIEELKKPRKKNQNSAVLKRRSVEHYNHTINVGEEASRLVIAVISTTYDDKKKDKNKHKKGEEDPEPERVHNAVAKRLKVTRLLDVKQAQDSLFRQLAYVNIFDDELLFPTPQDSL